MLWVQEELGSPALAFTRGVCEVLGLDGTVAEEVAILRRNLLRLIQTREFGEDAAFKVISPPFFLHVVMPGRIISSAACKFGFPRTTGAGNSCSSSKEEPSHKRCALRGAEVPSASGKRIHGGFMLPWKLRPWRFGPPPQCVTTKY